MLRGRRNRAWRGGEGVGGKEKIYIKIRKKITGRGSELHKAYIAKHPRTRNTVCNIRIQVAAEYSMTDLVILVRTPLRTHLKV